MLFKALKTVLLTSITLVTTNTFANNQTVSLGYAQIKIKDSLDQGSEDLKGFNLQYRYEWNSPVSLLVSTSYLTGDDKRIDDDAKGYQALDIENFSLLAGPAYRFNDFVSAYALGGFARTKIEHTDKRYDGSYYDREDYSKSNFAYGAGIIVNPTPSLSFNVGYEGTKIASEKLNGFNVGIGYRF